MNLFFLSLLEFVCQRSLTDASKMASTPPSRPLIKGPLQAPRQPPAAASYVQPRRLKSETDVYQPEEKRGENKSTQKIKCGP